jgi:hypothetical protein
MGYEGGAKEKKQLGDGRGQARPSLSAGQFNFFGET